MAWIEHRCVGVRGESLASCIRDKGGWKMVLCDMRPLKVFTLLFAVKFYYLFLIFKLVRWICSLFSCSGIKRRLFNLWLSSRDTCLVSVSDRSCTFSVFFCYKKKKKGTHLNRIYHFKLIPASYLGQHPVCESRMLESCRLKWDVSWNWHILCWECTKKQV